MLSRYLFIFLLLIHYASGDCPHSCSGHGICSTNNICICEDLFDYAPDCSKMICPKGLAWADKAYGENTAHVSLECSNQGVCNRNSVSAVFAFLYFCFKSHVNMFFL